MKASRTSSLHRTGIFTETGVNSLVPYEPPADRCRWRTPGKTQGVSAAPEAIIPSMTLEKGFVLFIHSPSSWSWSRPTTKREQRLMLRVDPAKPWLRRRQRPIAVPGTRLGGQQQRQDKRFWLGSGGLAGYIYGLKSAKWEILADWNLRRTPMKTTAVLRRMK